MKSKAIIIIFSFLLGVTPLFAQTGTANGGSAGSDIPPRVQVNFNARYPESAETAQWQHTEEGYQARFSQNGQKVESTFNRDGQWLRSRTEIREGDWPANLQKYVKENHPQYQYQQGYLYENEKGARYEVSLRSQNKDYVLNFDKNGGFIGEK